MDNFSNVFKYAHSKPPGPISDETSYRQISQSLEDARSSVKMPLSFWHLTGTSTALLPRYLSNFRSIGQFWIQISRLRGFARSYDKTPYRVLKHGPGAVSIWICRLSRIGIPMLKIRRSLDRLIFNMAIAIHGLERPSLYWDRAQVLSI